MRFSRNFFRLKARRVVRAPALTNRAHSLTHVKHVHTLLVRGGSGQLSYWCMQFACFHSTGRNGLLFSTDGDGIFIEHI